MNNNKGTHVFTEYSELKDLQIGLEKTTTLCQQIYNILD